MNLYFSILISMISFTVIAGGLILAFINYQKKIVSKQRELHKLDIQYKQDLLANTIQSAEAERTRIAKDIHDEIGSIFSTLSLSINQIKPGDTANAGHYQNCKQLIQTGITSVRRISHAIIPFEIKILGLEQTLDDHFHSMTVASSLVVDFDTDFSLDLLTDSASLAVYRIVQELTSNTIKYAGAKKIAVTLKTDPHTGLISIIYKDDGVGTEMHKLNYKTGIGLKNIESRALALNGTANFISKPGEGFLCHVVIPSDKNTVLC